MTRELLKQALDALLDIQLDTRSYFQQQAVADIRQHLAQPPATSADYAMGYAEGFNDACKPAQPAPVPVGYFYLDEDVWKQARDAKFRAWHTPLYAAPVPADEMDAVASKYAHKMALDLECVLSDYNGRWWDTAMNTIGEYRSAMNAIHERESPTFMGEPSIAASPEVPK